MKKIASIHFDFNLIGIIFSTIFIGLCLLLPPKTIKDENWQQKCDILPNFLLNDNFSNVYTKIINAINNSKNEILVMSQYANNQILTEYFQEPFKIAIDRGIKISFIMPNDLNLTYQFLSSIGATNFSFSYFNTGFIVIDNEAIYYPNFLHNVTDHECYLHISNCSTLVNDFKVFFNYHWLQLHNKAPKVYPMSLQAKTSIVYPLPIDHTNSSLFMFHNPTNSGEPIRVATESVLTAILYRIPSGSNIYLFSSYQQSLESDLSFSFFSLFKRILMANNNPIYYLFPISTVFSNESRRWLKAISAFPSAHINLYEGIQPPDMIITDDFIFFFSHPMADDIVANNVGFHLATNNSDIVKSAKIFFKEVNETAIPFNTSRS